MEKDCFYFSHDYNARTDIKIKNLIRKHGMKAYGIYWSIVEDLYNNANALQTNYEGIAYDLRESVEVVKSVINDFDLFVLDGDNFGSESVERRLNKRNEKSKKARESASYRWKKKRENANVPASDANALQTESDGNAIKERKEKDSKGNQRKGYQKCLLSEVEPSDYPELKPDYIEIAKAFKVLFTNNLVEAGATTANIDKAKGTWVDDIRLIIEADKYSLDDLRSAYTFLQKNVFWKKNIMSTSKLREKMDKIKLELKNGNNRNSTKEAATSWEQLAGIVHEAFAG